MAEKNGRAKAADVNRRIRNSNRGKGFETAEYSGCDAGLLQQAINAVTARGCAIQFGLTRDGETFCIRIVGDGEPYNEYCRPTEDFDIYLAGLISDFEAVEPPQK